MLPLEMYYLIQVGRGLTLLGSGLFYFAPLYLQRGHGIGKVENDPHYNAYPMDER